jgi:hypothetical protein
MTPEPEIRFVRVVRIPPDEGGRCINELRFEYCCPFCMSSTYVIHAEVGEGVQENLAAGFVPPDVLSGEVRPCGMCEHALQHVN